MLDKVGILVGVNAETELTHLGKVVLSSMVSGAVLRGGHWEFSSTWPAWSVAINVSHRGIVSQLRNLEAGGYIERLTPPHARKPRFKIAYMHRAAE